MGVHDAGGAAVLGHGGLGIRGSRDHDNIAGFCKCAYGKEFQHGVAAGEPDRQRRHLKFDVGLQQLGQGGHVGVFECRAVAVEQFAALRIVGLDGVVFGGRDLGQAGPCPL